MTGATARATRIDRLAAMDRGRSSPRRRTTGPGADRARQEGPASPHLRAHQPVISPTASKAREGSQEKEEPLDGPGPGPEVGKFLRAFESLLPEGPNAGASHREHGRGGGGEEG